MPTYVDGVAQGSGGGDASGLRASGAYGFTASDLYTGAVGTIQGESGGFSACVLIRLRRLPTTREIVFGTFRRFVGGGWAVAVEAARIQLWLTQASDGTKLGNFVGGDWPEFPLGKLFLVHFVWDGTTARLYVNGQQEASITPTSGITFDATVGPALGAESQANEPFSSGAIMGAAYGTHVMSASEVEAHTLAVMDAAQMVDDPGTGFADLWTFDGLSAAPASLPDALGAVDLVLSGTLAVEASPVHWL